MSFVFPKMLANGYAKYVAEAAAHESGHAFGLQHQSRYDTLGNKLEEYAPANAAEDAPIMGGSYTARRGLWRYGTASDSVTHLQDDPAVISSSTNGFGYRADDYGNTLASAASLVASSGSFGATGVIEQKSDADVFSFTAGAGVVSLSIDPYATGGMLDAKLDLRDAAGNLVATSDSGLSESLIATVTGGTYYVSVSSHGGYGDVGQYSLRGSVPLVIVPTVPAAPTNLAARALTTTSNRITWSDNSTDETGFKVFGSRDGVRWTLLGTVGPNVSAVDHTGLKRNTTYYYKVRAFNTVGDSLDSNIAGARTTLTAAVALVGDINLDGNVDFDDLVIMAQNYNTTGASWGQGDLNGDGTVDFNDLALLGQNYGSAMTDPADGDWGVITPSVDENVVSTPGGGTASNSTALAASAKTARVKAVFSKALIQGRPSKVIRPAARRV